MSSHELRKQYISGARRIVVKIGTNVIGGSGEDFNQERVDDLSEQIAAMVESGLQIAVVSSGSIGAGIRQLGLSGRPRSLPGLQAAASVGQAKLVACYDRSFRRHGLHAGQILLTRDDFDSRERYLNAANTMHALFDKRCVPVINENDTISTEEIQFGDNDLLAAFVTHLIRADLLVLLTAAPGLCACAPFPDNLIVTGETGPQTRFGSRVSIVKKFDDRVLGLACVEKTPDGTGGMQSKLAAAKIAVEAGEAAVIADGRSDDTLPALLEGRDVGTLFLPSARRLGSRKRWIRFTRRVRGAICVDAGAVDAICERGKSLLPSGITDVRGDFRRGDMVSVCGPEGREAARGLTNYSAEDIRIIRGLKTGQLEQAVGHGCFDEVIHRDNMALT